MDSPKTLALICRLKKHLVGEHAEFVPIGTPAEVIGWDTQCDQLPSSQTKLRVKVTACLVPMESRAEIRSGVEFSVGVEDLEFLAHWTRQEHENRLPK